MVVEGYGGPVRKQAYESHSSFFAMGASEHQCTQKVFLKSTKILCLFSNLDLRFPLW